jgi:hypothetical protein
MGVLTCVKNYEKKNVFVFCNIPTRYHNSSFLDIGYVSHGKMKKNHMNISLFEILVFWEISTL